MFKHTTLAILLATGIAACAQSTPASPELAPLLAKEVGLLRAEIGEGFFGFFSLRDAKSDGNTLVLEWHVNAELTEEFAADPAAFEAGFREDLLSDVCSDPALKEIIEKGGALRHAFFSEGGDFLTSITATNCET